MSAQKNNPALDPAGDDILSAISAFEKIVEVMPNDVGSLAALAQAYSEIGDHAKAAEYFVRLGDEVLLAGDAEAAADLVERLAVYSEDQRAVDLSRRLTEMLKDARIGGAAQSPASGGTQTAGEADAAARKAAIDVESLSAFRIADELSLAWNLMEADELTQDEYAAVVQDLSEMSASSDNLSVSVLHVLEARGFKQFDRVLSTLSRDCGTPFVSLSSHEFLFSVMSLLPLGFCVRRGALVFEKIGAELLVAILNPQDPSIRRAVETLTGARCHFYLALPSEFDQTIARYRETIEHAAETGA